MERATLPPAERAWSLGETIAEILAERPEEERIAIMAALNMSHEILHNQQLSDDMNDLDQRIESLSERISETMRNIQLI